MVPNEDFFFKEKFLKVGTVPPKRGPLVALVYNPNRNVIQNLLEDWGGILNTPIAKEDRGEYSCLAHSFCVESSILFVSFLSFYIIFNPTKGGKIAADDFSLILYKQALYSILRTKQTSLLHSCADVGMSQMKQDLFSDHYRQRKDVLLVGWLVVGVKADCLTRDLGL